MASAHTNGTKGSEEQKLDNSTLKSRNGVDGEALQKISEESQSARKAIQKAHMKSNIFSGESSVVDGTPSRRPNQFMKSSIFSNSESIEVATPRRSKPATGNPITGEGYLNGNLTEDGQRRESSPMAQKKRQPPGGYSTKLW